MFNEYRLFHELFALFACASKWRLPLKFDGVMPCICVSLSGPKLDVLFCFMFYFLLLKLSVKASWVILLVDLIFFCRCVFCLYFGNCPALTWGNLLLWKLTCWIIDVYHSHRNVVDILHDARLCYLNDFLDLAKWLANGLVTPHSSQIYINTHNS